MQTNSQNSTQVQEPILYTTDEVAKIFRVSTRTIQNWRDKGQIEFHQINHVILYSKDDVDELLKKYHTKNNSSRK
jgi:excisionase family DNA binding protein